MGTSQFGINKKTIDSIVEEIKQVYDLGVGLAIVIGGGNIFRGVALGATGLERATADYMGMIATIMNAIALQDAMRQAKVEAKVQSAIRIDQIVEPYMRQKAMKYLNEKKVVIFAAGTGNPFFTTDTAAALRGAEIGAELLIKATRVDGIYESDPEENPNAKMYDSISFDEVINKKLRIMDAVLPALEPNLTRRISSAFSNSPPASMRAFLHSIIGASVLSLNAFTSAALI